MSREWFGQLITRSRARHSNRLHPKYTGPREKSSLKNPVQHMCSLRDSSKQQSCGKLHIRKVLQPCPSFSCCVHSQPTAPCDPCDKDSSNNQTISSDESLMGHDRGFQLYSFFPVPLHKPQVNSPFFPEPPHNLQSSSDMSRNTLASNELLAYVLILVNVKVNDVILNPKREIRTLISRKRCQISTKGT